MLKPLQPRPAAPPLKVLSTRAETAGAAQPPQGWPLLRLGFRPFYLAAAAWGVVAMAWWALALAGRTTLPADVNPTLWHAHEMLFGFATTVVVGFVLTAAKAWTGLGTARGPALGALVLVWLGARVAAVTGPYAVYAALDMALLPLVALQVLVVLLHARNRRNLPLVALLLLLSAANVAYHGAHWGWSEPDPLHALRAALLLLVLVETVIGARVIPAFTTNATPGLKVAAAPWLAHATFPATALALALWWSQAAPAAWSGPLLLLAAALQALRSRAWHPLATAGRPILWVLHAAYAWIPIGLVLLALQGWGIGTVSTALHAFAVGATAGLIIGMVTRTARGHTGRPLQASPPEVLAYALVQIAALARVVLPTLAPQTTPWAWQVAAWSLCTALALYLWRYTPWLMSARLDGKDG